MARSEWLRLSLLSFTLSLAMTAMTFMIALAIAG
jgi:hypothetical protein